MFKKFPNYIQHDEKDCGPTCLRIISRFYGKKVSTEFLRQISSTNRGGTSLLSLSSAAEKIGLKATGARLSLDDLKTANALPCILLWGQKHYVVIWKIKSGHVLLSDPAKGLIKVKMSEFKKHWEIEDSKTGIILALEITESFDKNASFQKQATPIPFILSYIKQYKRVLIQLLVGLVLGSLLQLVFPFLTQSIVDTGIANRDVPFIYLILFSQLMVFLGKTAIEISRSYILLHLSNRINISLLSDFFKKLFRLPLGYFDKKMVGDIFQRIYDHQRVENFLTSSTLNFTFSFISLFVFSIVLFHYSPSIFLCFVLGSVLYFVWVYIFMKRRAKLDGEKFHYLKSNQDKNFEMILGMQEIKLHNADNKKRGQWEDIQSNLFRVNINSLTLGQLQSGGANIINELKNIVISFICAIAVVKGELTLGMMLAVSYIIGQLNAPISQMLDFIQSLQDAKLSLDRIGEVHNKQEEDAGIKRLDISNWKKSDIVFNNVTFNYDESLEARNILDRLNFVIPRNRVTAIVGSSGSGKTTILKLLLKFYNPTSGSIDINGISLSEVDSTLWRQRCGVVMQEGFIFDDNIINNIAVGDEFPAIEKVRKAAQIANLLDYIDSLPLGFATKIGNNGLALSTGQKQRILIARAIYKNPDILIFDEATSALDANNERIIVENLNELYKGKTVIIIAHRLSTVKSADNIIVLNNGTITESGSHNELVVEKGFYFHLVKNQLELGA